MHEEIPAAWNQALLIAICTRWYQPLRFIVSQQLITKKRNGGHFLYFMTADKFYISWGENKVSCWMVLWMYQRSGSQVIRSDWVHLWCFFLSWLQSSPDHWLLLHLLVFGSNVFCASIILTESVCGCGFYSPPLPFRHQGTVTLWPFCELCTALLVSQPVTSALLQVVFSGET